MSIELIPGRLLIFGYDKEAVVPGGGSALNDGIILSCPSRNVSYKAALGLWDAEIGQTIGGTTYWTRLYLPREIVAYYPDDNTHNWLDGLHDAEVLGDGYFDTYGYDGSLVIEGDLIPGADNGRLFRRPCRNVHVMTAAKLYHMELLVKVGGVEQYHYAVYPTNMGSFIPVAA